MRKINIRQLRKTVSILLLATAYALIRTIDEHFESIDLRKKPGAGATQSEKAAWFVTVYKGTRPCLLAETTLPLPVKWRKGLRALLDAADSLSLTVDPDFKAGKDV